MVVNTCTPTSMYMYVVVSVQRPSSAHCAQFSAKIEREDRAELLISINKKWHYIVADSKSIKPQRRFLAIESAAWSTHPFSSRIMDGKGRKTRMQVFKYKFEFRGRKGKGKWNSKGGRPKGCGVQTVRNAFQKRPGNVNQAPNWSRATQSLVW